MSMDYYYLIGHPVNHSLSPKIQNQFAQLTGQNMMYDKMAIPPSDIETAFQKLQADDRVKGLSVTVPHKRSVYHLVDDVDQYAQDAGAVSNVIFKQDQSIGVNVDGIGLVNDLKNNHKLDLNQCSILIIGAGGATQGILYPLIEQKPQSLTLTNRTLSKAQHLAEAYSPLFPISYQALNEQHHTFDLIINATSASLSGQLPAIPPSIGHKQTFIYDLMYQPGGTVLTQWAHQNGMRAADGLGMLIELSCEIFYQWRHIRPDISQLQL